MRLKLVLITSLLAALVGAGASIAIILFVFSSLASLRAPGVLLSLILLLPVATTLLASIFVYRHTARRRKLQAFLTALLATFLSLCFFLVAAGFTKRPKSSEPPPPIGPTVSS